MSSLPEKPQPDALPSASHLAAPSLWIYAVLLAVSCGLIAIAFHYQANPDWPGLFLNLASGLIGAVVILVFVDHRMRSAELEAVRKLPRTAVFAANAWFTPSGRLTRNYCRSLLLVLDNLLQDKLYRPAVSQLEVQVLKGFVLCAPPGGGKTTWLQMVSQSLATKALSNVQEGRVPIVFSLRTWRTDCCLEQAIYDLVSSFSSCSRWTFARLLRSGRAVLLLDGYDELWDRSLLLTQEVSALRKKYPKLACSVTTRPGSPLPDEAVFGSSATLPQPTEDEIIEIRRRRARRAKSV